MPIANFQEMYQQGRAPWDVGHAQPVFVNAEKEGLVTGLVLDVGCGPGDNALFLAEKGYQVWGVDAAPWAIEEAKRRAGERKKEVNFRLHDALDLGSLGRQFDTVIDSGLFHCFTDEERPKFIKSLASVIKPGGRYLMLCFSEREKFEGGPRRVTREEIRQCFDHAAGWNVDAIREAHFDASIIPEGAKAWFSVIQKR